MSVNAEHLSVEDPSPSRKKVFNGDYLMTPKEVADALRMSRTKLYNLWSDKSEEAPPYFHIRKNRFVSKDDFEAFVKSRPRVRSKLN